MALTNIEVNVILDLYDHNLTQSTIKAIALDKGSRYVKALIRDRETIYDIGADTQVVLTVIRPDKTGVQITGQPSSYTSQADDGSPTTVYGAYAELTQTALAIKGTLQAQFKFTNGQQILRSEIFTINNGVALDSTVSEWAGEYQGYNLDELVQNVNESAAKVDAMEQDVSDLKSGFNDLYNTAYVTDSASGSVAHFVDGADNVPMKSLKVNIAPVQSGSGDPSPSNVRPISGWDSVKVTRTGKNLLKPPTVSTSEHNGISFTYMSDGEIVLNGTSTAVAYSATQNGFRLPVGQYIKNTQSSDGIGVIVQTKTSPNWTTVQGGRVSDRTVTISADDTLYDLAVRIRIPSGITLNDYVYYPMLRHASDADGTYEPYNGNEYDISLASAGTVYGGTLDVVSGELTVDKKMVTIDGGNYALGVLSGVYNNRYCYRNTYLGGIIEKNLPSETTNACCNMLKSISRSNATSASNGIFQYHGDNDELRFLFPLEDAYSTPDKIYALGLECCIPLATPLTYQLSATEIKSLLGINNVWSDAGDVDVEYRADTKLYIKRLTGSDTDMIADANIASGQYFMVGNDLYRATVNIASGAQIVVGTNATKVSLSEALNEINA